MNVGFAPQGWGDYRYWQSTDKAVLKRINRLIDDALRSPTEGIGHPEPLKYGLVGAWSRRITQEHRLVHQVIDEQLVVLQARYHYMSTGDGRH